MSMSSKISKGTLVVMTTFTITIWKHTAKPCSDYGIVSLSFKLKTAWYEPTYAHAAYSTFMSANQNVFKSRCGLTLLTTYL